MACVWEISKQILLCLGASKMWVIQTCLYLDVGVGLKIDE
jgi:hypothetical protein